MRRIFITLSLASAALVGRPLSAQVRSQLPSGYNPPAGLCRVWIDGVAPNRQPAPVDCATAFRTHPANSRVIVGQQGNANGTTSRDERDYRLQNGGNDNKNPNYKNGHYKKGKKNGHYKNGKYKNGNNQNGSYRNDDGDEDDGNYRNGTYNQNGTYRNDGQQNGQTCVDRNGDGWCDSTQNSQTTRSRRATSGIGAILGNALP